MQVVGVVRSFRRFRSNLSHHMRTEIPSVTTYFLCSASYLGQYTSYRHFSMSSHVGKEEWPASRVRETFLDYFKKNGHTFGTMGDMMSSLTKLTR